MWLAILPVYLLLTYIYNCDKYEKEPTDMLTKAFLWGFFGVSFLAIVGELSLSAIFNPVLGEEFTVIISTVISAPLFEEGFKFMFLYLLIWNDKNFNEHFDGIVYAVYISMGFACLENILYVFAGGSLVGIIRAIYSVPSHFINATVMGYFFALARFNRDREGEYLSYGLLGAMFTHALFNGTIVFSGFFGSSDEAHGLFGLAALTVLSIILWIFAVRNIRRLSELSKDDSPALEAEAKLRKNRRNNHDINDDNAA